MFELRPYQKAVLNHADIVAILMWLIGKRTEPPECLQILVVSATGTGKTAMFAAVARWLRDHNIRVLILTHRREILEQTVKAFFKLGVTCGQIQAGKPMTGDLIQVASIQTLVNRLDQIWMPGFLIIDETHHAKKGNMWDRVLSWLGPAVPRLGMSATPARTDGAGLRPFFGKMIMGLSPREATEQGYLTYPVVYTIPNELHEQYHMTRGDFDTAEQAKVMSQRQIVGDVIDHYRKRLDGAPTIVACVSIEHAHLMADQFEQAGYRSRAVWGDMDSGDRDKALQGLADGSVQVVTFCDLVGEGVDIPVCTGLILLRRTMSLVLYLQWAGRVGRPVFAPGMPLDTVEQRLAAIAAGEKPNSIILDHAGNFQLHGHPLADREWSLDSTKRPKGELAPATTTCPKCYGVWPGRPRSCPSCGHNFMAADLAKKQEELRVVEGELVEAGLSQDSAADMASFLGRLKLADATGKAKMLRGKAFELLNSREDEETRKRKVELLAEAVGYKKNWAHVMWEIKQKNERRTG